MNPFAIFAVALAATGVAMNLDAITQGVYWICAAAGSVAVIGWLRDRRIGLAIGLASAVLLIVGLDRGFHATTGVAPITAGASLGVLLTLAGYAVLVWAKSRNKP